MFEREIGYTKLDVRNYGALGNGVQNDTYAFQCAINALPSGGGTVVAPPGRYMIDPIIGIQFRDRVAMQWIDGAALQAMPNDSERDEMLMLRDTSHNELINPVLIGNREDGIGTSGEWGHGIAIRGAQFVTIRGGHVSKFWGDGTSIGSDGNSDPATDIVICDGHVSHGNRRNGLTIGRCNNVQVYDSVFSGTFGTDPQAGIDVEPDAPGSARNFRIERCKAFGNAKTGILVWQRIEPELFIDRGVINDCDVYDNGVGIWTFGADNLAITNNRVRENRSHGLILDRGSNILDVRGNYFGYNFKRLDIRARAERVLAGQPSGQNDIMVRGATGVSIGINTYEAQVARAAIPA